MSDDSARVRWSPGWRGVRRAWCGVAVLFVAAACGGDASVDPAVNEQCHEFDECDLNQPFVDAGKPVFNAEYASPFVDDPDLVCPESLVLDIRTLMLPLDLDGSFRISCDDR